VLFNGNPLLRYDGYFVLSDLLGITNLWQESRRAVRDLVAKAMFGFDADVPPSPDSRIGIVTFYGLVSITYQWFVLVAILLLVFRWLKPMGLEFLAYLIAASVGVGMSITWLPALRRTLTDPSLGRRFKPLRTVVTVCSMLAAAGIVFSLPLPCRVPAPALIEPLEAQRVYVSTPGVLTEAVADGARVEAGQSLARLQNGDLARRIAELTGEHERLLVQVNHLDAIAAIDATAAVELVVTREICADAQQRLNQQRRLEDELTLRAPVSGIVIPPSAVSSASADDRNLPTWTGTPLDPQNINCFLERGTLFCLVGDGAHQEAVLFVDESDVPYVRSGQHVWLHFDVGPAVVISGRIIEIAHGDVEFVPAELAVDMELASRPDATGHDRPLRTTYQVRVRLDEPPNELIRLGMRGRAKIEVDPQTLVRRFYRWLRRTLAVEI
jgi:putative peptide zinc metalloprotease protein